MDKKKNEEKEEKQLLIVFGIILIILGIYLGFTADGGFKLIAFLPIPNWLYSFGCAGFGLYMLITGIKS